MNPFRYRGYHYDTQTGLYYLPQRYYNPQLGRFLNADTIENADLQAEFINGYNLYAYCLNNPVNEFDPTGGIIITALIKTAVIVTKVAIKKTAVMSKATAITTAAKKGKVATLATKAAKGAANGAVFGGELGFLTGGFGGVIAGDGWSWSGASTGLWQGALTGALADGLGGALTGAKHALTQAGIYAAINAGITAGKEIVKNGPSAFASGSFWADVGIAAGVSFGAGMFNASGILQNPFALIGADVLFELLKKVPRMLIGSHF